MSDVRGSTVSLYAVTSSDMVAFIQSAQMMGQDGNRMAGGRMMFRGFLFRGFCSAIRLRQSRSTE